MEGSNLRFLIQSQASYHWTNPQRRSAAGPGGGCISRNKGRTLSGQFILVMRHRTVKGRRVSQVDKARDLYQNQIGFAWVLSTTGCIPFESKLPIPRNCILTGG